MTISITHYKQRTCAYDITLTDSSGDAVTLSGGDKIRLKIWRENDATPLLDLVSGTPSSNNSSVTAANPTRFTLTQDDAVWTPGLYTIEVAIVDASDGLIRHADSGVFVLHKTPGGTLT